MVNDVIDEIFKVLSFLPDNIFVRAGVETLLVILLLFATGLIINGVSGIIVRLLAALFGGRVSYIFRNYLTWPGTVHHEFSHALFAFITGAKVTRISLIPHGQALGQVEYRQRGGRVLRALQMSLSSIAPILCGMVTETLLIIYVLPKCDVWWEYALSGYFIVSIFLHMTLSREDMTNLLNGILPTVFVLYCVFLIIGAVTG
ncbi:MAG: M50 family metallopeptidase [Lachnospiraceae bacterium]|nr:M50 family metallopeptidase [Lachnospiraceae bacterium]